VVLGTKRRDGRPLPLDGLQVLLLHESSNTVASGFYSLFFQGCRQAAAPVALVVVMEGFVKVAGQSLAAFTHPMRVP